jgi:hypothetical protein
MTPKHHVRPTTPCMLTVQVSATEHMYLPVVAALRDAEEAPRACYYGKDDYCRGENTQAGGSSH